MNQIQSAGIDVLVHTWTGIGKFEDKATEALLDASVGKVEVAFHYEPQVSLVSCIRHGSSSIFTLLFSWGHQQPNRTAENVR